MGVTIIVKCTNLNFFICYRLSSSLRDLLQKAKSTSKQGEIRLWLKRTSGFVFFLTYNLLFFTEKTTTTTAATNITITTTTTKTPVCCVSCEKLFCCNRAVIMFFDQKKKNFFLSCLPFVFAFPWGVFSSRLQAFHYLVYSIASNTCHGIVIIIIIITTVNCWKKK